jgi:plastocyanin
MNAFVVVGAVLAAWAVIVSLLGMRGFPRGRGAERAAIGITVVLFFVTIGAAIGDQTKVGERHGPEKHEEAGQKPEEPVQGAAPSEQGQGGGTASGDAAAPAPASPAGTPTSLALTADPNGGLKFDKAALDAPAGEVTIVMTNPSAVPHDISVRGDAVDEHGDVVTDGGKSTVKAELKAGAYEFYCSIPGHEQGGMKGTLTVK